MRITDDLRSIYAAIYTAICSMHRRNRTVASAYDTELSPMESTALPEIEGVPGITLGELAHRLHIDQVGITRLVQGLIGKGFVEQRRAAHDGRARELRLSDEGRTRFELSASRAFLTFNTALERVPESQRGEFLALLKRFNDGLDAAPAALLPMDPIGMVEIRRISRVLGLLDRSIFGTLDCSPIEWHLYDLLSPTDANSYVVELADRVGASPKALASIVQRQIERGFIQQEVASHDKRMRRISLTSAGRSFFDERVAHALTMIARGTSSFSPVEVARFRDLVQLYTGADLPAASTIIDAHLWIRRVSEPSELTELRQFIYRERVTQEITNSTVSTLLPSTGIAYGIWLHAHLTAVMSFVPGKRKGVWSIEHLVWSDDSVEHKQRQVCLFKVMDQLTSFASAASITVETKEISPSLRELVLVHPIVRAAFG